MMKTLMTHTNNHRRFVFILHLLISRKWVRIENQQHGQGNVPVKGIVLHGYPPGDLRGVYAD